VVRDLHDGAQQRLVHAVMTLQLAHGLHPALLTTRGLAAAVEALAGRAPVPVRVETGDAFELQAAPHQALDVFDHPYVYTASTRRVRNDRLAI